MNFLAHLSELWVQLSIVVFGLWAGVLGAYGRELNEQRKPTLTWWISRVAILPVLGIITSALIDQFKLSRQQSALLASMLALSGYEALRVIQARFIKKVGGGDTQDEPIAPSSREPAPYASVVDTDSKGRTTTHVMPVDPDRPESGGIGEGLRGVYQAVTKDGLPDEMTDLLGEVDRRTHGDGNDSEDSPLQP